MHGVPVAAVGIHINAPISGTADHIVKVHVAVGGSIHILHKNKDRIHTVVGKMAQVFFRIHIQAVSGVGHPGAVKRALLHIAPFQHRTFVQIHPVLQVVDALGDTPLVAAGNGDGLPVGNKAVRRRCSFKTQLQGDGFACVFTGKGDCLYIAVHGHFKILLQIPGGIADHLARIVGEHDLPAVVHNRTGDFLPNSIVFSVFFMYLAEPLPEIIILFHCSRSFLFFFIH